ncbi:sensor histidine kinase [Thorsellia kenyensis]|uniref:histidine kinase n=1 Tax=Thorsellia kenyensis TaxID=1549888 RepID=A0ABV6C7Y7_9GAMM
MRINTKFKMIAFYSLRQIVMVAFLLVLLPLLWLAYQAYDGFNQLSKKSNEINRNTAIYARRSEVMATVTLELERSARQYCILNDETFRVLHQEQKKQYAQMLEAHKPVLSELFYYNTLSNILKKLSNLTCNDTLPSEDYFNLLIDLTLTQTKLSQATREAIFDKGQELQVAIADKGNSMGQQALLLCIISFILVLLFTQMIIRPVNQIREMISLIAEGRKLNINKFNGPRELQVLAQRIVWLNERLNWLESQRHEFLRHVSHELKTPLASIREGTELLADQIAGALSQEQKEVVTILDKSGRELQNLIEQLLEYNRLALIDEIQLSEIELERIIDNTLQSHELLVTQKQTTVIKELSIRIIQADEMLLKRVIDNLISNAVHYSSAKGQIFVKSYHDELHDFIEIANSGKPISQKDRTMIFEPFYQGSSQRTGPIKGSGLGLSIAQNTIRRMSGELTLIDVEYAEVCFLIKLPRNTL